MQKEPVLIILGGLAIVFAALLACSNAMGWTDLNANQTTAAVAAVAAVCGLIAAAIRGQVYSPETYARDVANALATPAPLIIPDIAKPVLPTDVPSEVDDGSDG